MIDSTAAVPVAERARLLLARRAASSGSSAVRDLLAQAARPGMISLAGGLPDASLFPVAELAELTERLLRSDGRQVLQYGRTEGTDEARALLADHFDLGPPEQLLVTTGSQQGLDLLIRVLADPGDEVVVSDPEYLGFLQVLAANGARPVPIPSDGDGLDVDLLADRLAAGLRPKACYLVPHFHNPSGATISPERHARLRRLSQTYGFVIIEDDPYRDLFFDVGGPAADPSDSSTGADNRSSIGGSASDDHATLTVRLRTTSKTLAPGLRLAVVHAPGPIHEAMVIAKQSCDLHASTLSQAVVCAAVASDWFPGHVDRLRASYRAKCSALVEELRSVFGDRVRVNRPAGGMFVWADFDGSGGQPIRTTTWLPRALAHGVCFVPGLAFAVESDLSTMARLSFATVAERDIGEAVSRLADSVI